MSLNKSTLANSPDRDFVRTNGRKSTCIIRVYFVSMFIAGTSESGRVDRPLEMDDTLAETHTALAFIKTDYDWDWSGGVREFQRAIALNPDYANAHMGYGWSLVSTGRFEEAITKAKRAVELDSLSLGINWFLGSVFYFARQYDQAIEQYRKTLELDPNFFIPRFRGFY